MRTLPTIRTGFEAPGTLDLRGVAEVPVPPTLLLLLVGLAVLRCRARAGRQGPDVGWRMAPSDLQAQARRASARAARWLDAQGMCAGFLSWPFDT